MSQDLQKHVLDYLLLTTILVSGFSIILVFKFDREVQILTSILLGVGYAVWGIIHHSQEGNLTLRTLLEYIAISTFVTTTLIVLLMRA